MILETYARSNRISVSEKCNRLLYWMSNAPILKKFFHDDLVSEYVSKEGIALLVRSLTILRKLAFKVIYILILALVLQASWPAAFNIFFVAMAVLGCFMHDIIAMDIEDYNNVILLRMNPHEYAMMVINEYLISETVLFFLAFCMLTSILQLPLYVTCYSLLAYLGIHLIGQAVTIWKTMKNGYIEYKNGPKDYVINSVIFLSSIAIMVLTIKLHVSVNVFVLMALELPFIIAGVYSYLWLKNKPDYHRYFRYNLTIEKINQMEAITNTSEASETIASLNKGLKLEKADSSKHGYDFIFDTFLKRYKNMFTRRNILTLAAIAILAVVAAVVPLLFDFDRRVIAEFIYSHLHWLFLVIYFFSGSSKSFVLSCFLQIDRYLVNYHFFRRGQDIIRNFRLRLGKVILISILPSALLAVSMAFLYWFHGLGEAKPSEIAVILLLPLVLALFYSIYYLAAYYLFQPFSFDGTVLNRTYSIVTSVIYGISYVLSDIDNIRFSVPVLAIIIVVLAVLSAGLFAAVYKLAPKEFRVR